jgi:MFS family permease
VFALAINALMADITKPENLAFRLGMIGVTSALAQPISPIIGAYIYSKFGYIGVFSATLMGMLCAGILLLIRIRPYKWKREKKEVCFIVTVICPRADLT